MAKRTKKGSVSSELRREWLRRNEIEGESPPQIAKKDYFDVRTVRKQIQLAKEEREGNEARSMVLRNALESHYQDLCKYTDALNSSLISEDKSPEITTDHYLDPHMGEALRQHLPRSPIWRGLSRWNQLNEKVNEQVKEIKRQLKEGVERDPKLSGILAAGESQAIANIIEVLTFQATSWARGRPGLDIKVDFQIQPMESGLTKVRYGFAQMSEVEEGHPEQILEVLKEFESRIRVWEQYENMRRSFTELDRVKRDLREELAVITYRRVVPGKCKYCPI